jgi:hypothetical protein
MKNVETPGTGVPPVPEHGRDGRGTSLVAASLRYIYSNEISFNNDFVRDT